MSAHKIALIGASGNVGSRLLNEAVQRGHSVTGIARHPDKIATSPKVTAKKGDLAQVDQLAEVLKGNDVIVSSVKFQGSNVQDLISAAKKAGIKRLLIVGGAGSLEVAPGKALIDTPEFPEIYKAEAGAGRDWLNALRKEKDLDWTFLSPSALFIPGKRTGQFRVGKDQLLVAGNGESSISMEDFAIAMLDEIEKPKHIRERFTVGY